MMKQLILILAATALMALGLSRSVSADFVVYAATVQGEFGTLDLTTGAYSSIGSRRLWPPLKLTSIPRPTPKVRFVRKMYHYRRLNSVDSAVTMRHDRVLIHLPMMCPVQKRYARSPRKSEFAHG